MSTHLSNSAAVAAIALQAGDSSGKLAKVLNRDVIRCDHCKLVQFKTANENCRRCKKSLPFVTVEVAGIPEPPVTLETKGFGPPALGSIARTILNLRLARHLSQSQLADRMHVPRTYVSKIENSKAIPTLESFARFANALGIKIHDIFKVLELDEENAGAIIDNGAWLVAVFQMHSQCLTNEQRLEIMRIMRVQ